MKLYLTQVSYSKMFDKCLFSIGILGRFSFSMCFCILEKGWKRSWITSVWQFSWLSILCFSVTLSPGFSPQISFLFFTHDNAWYFSDKPWFLPWVIWSPLCLNCVCSGLLLMHPRDFVFTGGRCSPFSCTHHMLFHILCFYSHSSFSLDFSSPLLPCFSLTFLPARLRPSGDLLLEASPDLSAELSIL